MRALGPVRGRVAERVILHDERLADLGAVGALSVFEAAVDVIQRVAEAGAFD